MVEDTVGDGKRIAQLLASECSGLDNGALGHLTVGDASPDAVPSEDGAEAYRLAYRGEAVAVVRMFPDRVRLAWADDGTVPPDRVPRSHDREDSLELSGDAVVIRSGSAVKPAVDLLRAVLAQADTDGGDGGGE